MAMSPRSSRLVNGLLVVAHATFTSVFVVNASTGLAPSDDLTALAPLRFTYGSETSTSGRLMPAWFLREAGVDPQGFPGGPGFSGSHDATLALVASGSYQAGVLNSQVWRSRSEEGAVDPAVVLYTETPPYADYHWLLGPQAAERTGVPDLRDMFAADTRWLQHYGFSPFQAPNSASGLS